jgi:hypothetical protein
MGHRVLVTVVDTRALAAPQLGHAVVQELVGLSLVNLHMH